MKKISIALRQLADIMDGKDCPDVEYRLEYGGNPDEAVSKPQYSALPKPNTRFIGIRLAVGWCRVDIADSIVKVFSDIE